MEKQYMPVYKAQSQIERLLRGLGYTKIPARNCLEYMSDDYYLQIKSDSIVAQERDWNEERGYFWRDLFSMKVNTIIQPEQFLAFLSAFGMLNMQDPRIARVVDLTTAQLAAQQAAPTLSRHQQAV